MVNFTLKNRSGPVFSRQPDRLGLVLLSPVGSTQYMGRSRTGCGCGCLIWKQKNRTELDLKTLPEIVISDRGPFFISKTYRSLMKLCEIKQRVSTAYHPQTDGETERVNRELETYLRVFCKCIPEDWDKHLPMAEFTYNRRPHSVTKQTPFYLMYGSKPTGFPMAFPKTNVPAVEEQISRLLKARDDT